jgi:hypothetical protein
MTAPDSINTTVALLTPIPTEHLADGLPLCQREGLVMYGTQAWKVFDDLDQERGDRPVVAYIYASREGKNPAATHRAVYVKHCFREDLPAGDFERYRPPSTNVHPDDRDTWAAFYYLRDLERLAQPIPIRRFRSWKRKQLLVDHWPEGPILVDPEPMTP